MERKDVLWLAFMLAVIVGGFALLFWASGVHLADFFRIDAPRTILGK